MFSVLFEVHPKADQWDAYLGNAQMLRPELERIDGFGQQRITPSRAAPFEALVRAIVYQSVSRKAAAVIFARLKQAVGGTFSPTKILVMSEDSLASEGLSKSKSRAVLNLAEWFATSRKMAKALPDLAHRSG